MEEKKGKISDRTIGKLIVIALTIVVGLIAWGIWWVWWISTSFFGSGNYPLRFQKELDHLLGEDAWECVAVERKTTPFYEKLESDRNGDSHKVDGDYKKWLICYTDDNGKEYEFYLNNLTHKISDSKRTVFSSKYISNKECFGMNIFDFASWLTADKIKNEIVADIFEPEDYENVTANINGTGMRILLNYTEPPQQSYYKKIIDGDSAYQLRDFHVEDMLSDKEMKFFVSIEISTYKESEEKRADIDAKAAELKERLIEEYGGLASFEILVYHFNEGQEYLSSMEKDADRTVYCFVYQGNQIPTDIVRKVSGEGREPQLYDYMKAIK